VWLLSDAFKPYSGHTTYLYLLILFHFSRGAPQYLHTKSSNGPKMCNQGNAGCRSLKRVFYPCNQSILLKKHNQKTDQDPTHQDMDRTIEQHEHRYKTVAMYIKRIKPFHILLTGVMVNHSLLQKTIPNKPAQTAAGCNRHSREGIPVRFILPHTSQLRASCEPQCVTGDTPENDLP
jgi:hypothetical protein